MRSNQATEADLAPPEAGRVGPLAMAGRAMITVYQNTIGPTLPSSCRFYPTCSRYAYQAMGRFGFWKGSWMGLRRIGRCNPFTPSGVDPVPERKES